MSGIESSTIGFYGFSLFFLGLALVTGFRLRHMFRSTSRDPEIGIRRSPDFYRPMERLLSETDFRYLMSRPEIPASSINRMRRDRRKIFRKYLSFLAADFSVITSEIRTIMVRSEFSRSDLAGTLMRAQIVFAVAILTIEARLLMRACGIHAVEISASRLVAGLSAMRSELNELLPLSAFPIQAS